ncbi:MAG: T9SS type A sorting domain-containing protein [Ignavibacteria bacterium]|jgi:polyhydroxybutyrate depolymerase
MSTIKPVLLALIVACTAANAQNMYDSVLVGSTQRTYMTHLPTGYDAQKRYAVLLAFHGGQQAGRTDLGWQALALQGRLSEKADDEGFIVVYPEGQVFATGRSWNAGDCCPPSASKGVDDVTFVSIMLDKLFRDYPIDTTRVYATGTSNGGMLCYRLACELSHRIAAIAPNACSHMIQPCNPGNRVPIISFHSKVDPVVRYKGGNGPEDVPFLKDVFFPSQDSNLIVWQKLNGCTKSDTIVNGGSSGYSFIRLSQCSCDVEVHHYATADGGHSWPGGVPNNVSPPSAQIDATDLLWEFVKRYTLGCAVSNVEQEIPMQVLQVYPNPAQSVLTVSGASFNSTYTVVDLFGRAIDRGLITGTIDVSSMKQGVYMITVTQGNKLQTVTFVRD